MRYYRPGTPTTGLFERPAWFRFASLMIAVEVTALVVLMVAPGSAPTPGAAAHRAAGAAGGNPDAGPRRVGERPAPPTTVPPAPTTTAAPTTTVPPAPAPAPRVATPPPARPPAPPAPLPASGHPILPPANPPANIGPQPNFQTACSASGDDNSPGCIASAASAIDNARQSEGLPAMSLPGNWGALSPPEQLYVATNLERTARGLPALSAMATLLDQAAAAGAAGGVDPSPPAGFPFEQWGANWAGGVGNPLEAIYYWMYDDGPGSSNADCTPGHSAGCWGHRDGILLSLACTPCVMGSGFAAQGWQGQPSWAELLVGSSGAPAVDFTWQQESSYLS